MVKKDPTVSRIARKWARGDIKAIKRVEELLAQAGLSMADVDLQSLSEKSGEFNRLDERDERLAGRRDEILRQIERRRSGWAKLVRRGSEEIVEGEFHELPSGTANIEAGHDASTEKDGWSIAYELEKIRAKKSSRTIDD